MLQQGHRVVLAARDEAKARATMAALQAGGAPADAMSYVPCSLDSLASVREAAAAFRQQHPGPLDVLLCCAGQVCCATYFQLLPSYQVISRDDLRFKVGQRGAPGLDPLCPLPLCCPRPAPRR